MSRPDISFQASQSLHNFLQAKMRRYDVMIGVLEDGPSAKWKKEQKSLAGGPANKVAGRNKEVTLRALMAKWNAVYNLLLAPWRKADNKEVVEVIGRMAADMGTSGRQKQAFLSAVQAAVRNPITRGDYGKNSPEWAKAKGFNRLLINTGTLFNNIKARFKNYVS